MSFDPVKLLEYMKKENHSRRGRRNFRNDPPAMDPLLALYEMKRTADEWKKFQDDIEKINKKDSKTGWDAMSFVQKLVIMTGIVPFIVVLQLCIPVILIVKILGLHQ